VPAGTRTFALGVGLTNACNLDCAHCYRASGEDELSLEQVLRAVDALPVRAVNFGTGENGLHPRFADVVRAVADRGIDVAMTTNGMSAEALPDDVLARFSDAEFSIDYPTRDAHDGARGAGNWDLIEAQMARCARLGVATAIVTVLMSTNHRALPALAELAGARGASLRVNVYQSVRGDAFSLRYQDFWDAWRRLFAVADVVACGEPILRAVLGLPRVHGAGCGVETVRLTPRAAVVPCVYEKDGALGLDDLVRLGERVVETPAFRALATVPDACRACAHVEACAGGCASRRMLRGGLDRPDELCPIVRGDDVGLRAKFAPGARLTPKASSACTVVVRARRFQ
jgi:radical SAM protein with 4Fe4S-binding SPASM domain